MMVKTIVVLMLSTFLMLTMAADNQKTTADNVKPVLKPGDVKNFIKNFPAVSRELKQLGADIDGRKGDINSMAAALAVNAKYRAVLQKHGWDEHFFQKWFTIMRGYAGVKYKDKMKESQPKIAESLKQIENNPHLSADMKKNMKKQLTALQGTLGQSMIFNVHKDDLALIKPHMILIEKTLEEMKRERRKNRRKNRNK